MMPYVTLLFHTFLKEANEQLWFFLSVKELVLNVIFSATLCSTLCTLCFMSSIFSSHKELSAGCVVRDSRTDVTARYV